MNEFFKKADKLLRDANERLNCVIGQDGEDVSYYNPEVLDSVISKLIEARSEMAIGRNIDGE